MRLFVIGHWIITIECGLSWVVIFTILCVTYFDVSHLKRGCTKKDPQARPLLSGRTVESPSIFDGQAVFLHLTTFTIKRLDGERTEVPVCLDGLSLDSLVAATAAALPETFNHIQSNEFPLLNSQTGDWLSEAALSDIKERIEQGTVTADDLVFDLEILQQQHALVINL